MADDPTGYADALATINENQLSERQQRISVGLAMIQDGASAAEAARVCGIPHVTMWRYARRYSELESKEGDGRAASIEALADEALVAARIATQRVTERLVDPDHEWKDSDLVKAQGVNIDKVLAFQNRGEGPKRSGVAAIIAMIEEGADITIRKRHPADDAVEVEADTLEDEGRHDIQFDFDEVAKNVTGTLDE